MLFSISTLQRLSGSSAELDSSVPPNKRMQQTARLGSKGRPLHCEAGKKHQTVHTRKLASDHAAADGQSRSMKVIVKGRLRLR